MAEKCVSMPVTPVPYLQSPLLFPVVYKDAMNKVLASKFPINSIEQEFVDSPLRGGNDLA